jgi:putative tryptophan/tyrosine transport system substrate-binding protein
MRRRTFLCVLGSAAVFPLSANSQAPTPRRILWLSTEAQPDPLIEAFRAGMRERGYIEGRNLSFVLEYHPGDPIALRAALGKHLSTTVDLVVSSGPAILASRELRVKTVLFVISSDPVAADLADSLAHPGRNFTGITLMSLDVAQKRVELLRELMPGLRTLAVLAHTAHFGEPLEYAATNVVADALSIRVVYAPFASGAEIETALTQVRKSGADALLAFPGGATRVHKDRIAGFANAMGLPSFYGSREHCEAGGLASYGASQRATYNRLAAFADRLFRGQSPASLPIEQPTTFELVFNLQTARTLGLEIPNGLLARADEVIE